MPYSKPDNVAIIDNNYNTSSHKLAKPFRFNAIKALLVGSFLSVSSLAFAVDTDGDGVDDILDGAPHDIELQKLTINRVINGDFEAGANYWAPNASQATYSAVANSFDGSTAIEVTTTKNNKGIFAPEMTGDGIKFITVNFWTKVTNAASPFKIKVVLKQPDGSAKQDKFLSAIQVDDNNDPDLTDDIKIINASEWTHVSKTYDLTAIQQEATDNDLDGDPATTFSYIDLDADGNYHEYIKLMIQPATAGDTILVDNIALYSEKDKAAMLLNAVTDSDSDGLMDDTDPHPTQAHHSELKSNDDFDNDGVINSADAQPYNPEASADLNNDGYADNQVAPLLNTFSDEELELTDAEQDNWSVVKFVSSKEAKVGATSFKVDNAATSKANIVTVSATEQVVLGFWAKTDEAGPAADGDAFTVKARLIGANGGVSDVNLTQVLDNTNLTSDWQYFQIEKNLNETHTVADVEVILLKPTTANAANIWLDGLVLFTDPDAEALLATERDTDSDGIFDFWDNDDDNDGLKDGEDTMPLTAVGSLELPDIDQDGNEDTADVNNNGVLDYFEDTTAPVITLLGDAVVTLTVGETYTDAGASALDETDGDVTADIVIENSVDTATIGSYSISYNVIDAANNAAIEVVRTVIVEPLPDIAVPVITILGDVTVTITEGDVYLDAGASALDELDGDISANIVTVNTVNTQSPGVYTVTYNVVDGDNNPAIEVTRTVIVEAIPEEVNVITITPTDNISVEATGATMAIELTAPSVTNSKAGVSATISHNAPESFPIGETIVTWTATDSTGNTLTTQQKVIVVDSSAPTFGLLADIHFEKADANSAITLTPPMANDNIDGQLVATTDFANGVYQPGRSYVITWQATDSSGNTTTATQNLTVTSKDAAIADENIDNSTESSGGSLSFAWLLLLVTASVRTHIRNFIAKK